jgi:hypothetical protein
LGKLISIVLGLPMQDRRKGVRLRAISGRDRAVLRIGLREFEVELKNESAQGFGVTCPEGVSVAVGDTFALGTESGWFEVKVVRSDNTPSGVVLGLQRGREIPSPQRSGLGVSKLTIIAAAAIGLLAIPAATVVRGYWRKHHPPTNNQPLANHPPQQPVRSAAQLP